MRWVGRVERGVRRGVKCFYAEARGKEGPEGRGHDGGGAMMGAGARWRGGVKGMMQHVVRRSGRGAVAGGGESVVL